MSRSNFGWWGRELADEAFARALAALGFAGAHYPGFPPYVSKKRLQDDIDNAFKSDGAVPWLLRDAPVNLSGLNHHRTARDYAEAWTQAFHYYGALEIRPNDHAAGMLPWLVEVLGSKAVNLESLYVVRPGRREMVSWRWPVRVGFLDDPISRERASSFRATTYGDSLARIETVRSSAEAYDLLIWPGNTRTALQAVLALPHRLRATCLVALGGFGEPWIKAQAIVEALLTQIDAEAVCVTDVPAVQQSQWFHAALVQLSHDNSLDKSFRYAANELQLAAPFLSASTQVLRDAQLSNFINRLSHRLEQLPPGTDLSVPPDAANLLGISFGLRSSRDLARDLVENAQHYAFQRESDEATGTAELMADAVEEALKAATPRTMRWIQGQVFAETGASEPVQLSSAMLPGTQHTLVVRIGPSDEDWLTPPTEAVFPDEDLEWDEEIHQLQVVFSEPDHAPRPQTASILLPRYGASSTCQFGFRTRDDIATFKGRIVVLHRNRVLQTALLESQVTDTPTSVSEEHKLALGIEGMIRPHLFGLGDREDFDLAIVANHNDELEMGVSTIAQERATFQTIRTGLQRAIEDIQSMLDEIVLDPDKFYQGLDTPENLQLLRGLAIKGSQLWEGIVYDQIGEEALKGIGRIQLVSAVEDYLPLEFLYDRPSPREDAVLCPNHIEALESGACNHCQENGNARDFVCPLGFYGLSRVIERHYVEPKWKRVLRGDDFALQADPLPDRQTLDVLQGAVFAASDRVDKGNGGQIDRVLEVLDDVTGHQARLVQNWNDWIEAIDENKPSLLVLMPHTLRAGQYDSLRMEIGGSEQLSVNDIDKIHIGTGAVSTGPIVFLLGCETLVPEEPFAGFTAKFRRNGSAIVISTFTPVLGRHVGPITEALVKELRTLQEQATGDVSFGDALLAVRRRVMAQGLPMVLCILAYGDAGWRLATQNAR